MRLLVTVIVKVTLKYVCDINIYEIQNININLGV